MPLSKNSYQGVLFDLDGTLLDSANDLGAALNYVLAKYKLPLLDKAQFRPYASDGAKGLIELGFAEQLERLGYEFLRAEFLSYYQKNIALHTCLYPGVEQLLTTLNQQNIPWGIVTNKPIGLTQQLLEYFPLLAQCHAILGGDSLPTKKPHPAPLLAACQQLAIAPQNCLFVGDAIRDIEAGNAANMFSIIAQWGYIRDIKQCENWQANFIANSPEEIAEIILSTSCSNNRQKT